MRGDITSDSDDDVGEYIEDINDGIVLTVGYVLGLRVKAMRPMPKATPLLRIVKVTNLVVPIFSNWGFT